MTRPLALVLLVAGCARSPAPDPPAVPLYDNLGTFSVPISSRVDLAQRYFDQGIRLTYAFNHAEAVRAFTEAARLDSTCAICHWGVALALGPNINAPMDSAAAAVAWAALERARALSGHADERERALIEALGSRYRFPPPVARAGLDSAYAIAMTGVVARFPDDREAATLAAEALMNLRPWDYWEARGKPWPGTERIVAELTRVLAADSAHPGACHYYIHLYEATEPARALPCAERLAALMPGAGHLVHMPAHIYVRVGRYDEAIEHNRHATHADSTFAISERLSPTYAALYVPHNYHFLGFAALLAGRRDLALSAARRTVETVPIEGVTGLPEYQPLLAFEHLMLQKFADWDRLIALPLPDTIVPVGRAVAQYARGTALAATGQTAAAEALLPELERVGKGQVGEVARQIVAVAFHSLAGEIAARKGGWSEAERHFRVAADLEDRFTYMEPPWWIEPVRHPLGMVLLEAGKPAEAERLFREDLERFPDNGWALAGLHRSLTAQGKADQAVTAALERAGAAAGQPFSTAHP